VKRPQTKFHAHAMSESQVIRSKKVKIYHRSKFIVRCKFSCWSFCLFIQYFIETAITDSDMLLQVWLQFCNNNGLFAISDVTM